MAPWEEQVLMTIAQLVRVSNAQRSALLSGTYRIQVRHCLIGDRFSLITLLPAGMNWVACLCFYCYRLFLFLADSQTQLMQLLPFFAKNIPLFHALLTWFFLVGYRETWSQEQCWFSGQYNGSKSLCKTRIRPITFTRFAFSPIGSLSSRASTVCTWCVRVHACVCVLD